MYFIFIDLHIIQYIIYRLLLPYFRFSNPDIKTEQEMNNTLTTSNANDCLQIAITTHNYLQISNTKHKKHMKG
jgi:hypothetical protein